MHNSFAQLSRCHNIVSIDKTQPKPDGNVIATDLHDVNPHDVTMAKLIGSDLSSLPRKHAIFRATPILKHAILL